MSATRRNFLWPILVLGIGLLLLLSALDLLPSAAPDLMRRAWPILLIVAGLNMFLIDRLRFGNWLALLLTGVILGGVVMLAYANQADTLRRDNVVEIPPIALGENIREMNISATLQDTTILFAPAPDRSLSAQFEGSRASQVSISAQEENSGILELNISETRQGSIPRLEEIGRGELRLTLPGDPFDPNPAIILNNLELSNQRGGATLDLRSVDVRRLNITLNLGDLLLYLDPQSVIIGTISLNNGNLRLIVPSDVPLVIRGAPSSTLNTEIYLRLEGGTIESRGLVAGSERLNLTLNLGGGALILEPPSESTEPVAE